VAIVVWVGVPQAAACVVAWGAMVAAAGFAAVAMRVAMMVVKQEVAERTEVELLEEGAKEGRRAWRVAEVAGADVAVKVVVLSVGLAMASVGVEPAGSVWEPSPTARHTEVGLVLIFSARGSAPQRSLHHLGLLSMTSQRLASGRLLLRHRAMQPTRSSEGQAPEGLLCNTCFDMPSTSKMASCCGP